MSKVLKIKAQHFEEAEKEIVFSWQLFDSPIVQIWIKNLILAMRLEQRNAFYRHNGFIERPFDEEVIRSNLKRCIDKINHDGRYLINEKAETSWSQDFSNAIHHHFEVLAGEAEVHNAFYLESSEDVQHAILGLNHCAHDLETFHRVREAVEKQQNNFISGLIVEFLDSHRALLPESAFQEFKLETQFAGIYLHYSEIGKTWWEVYYDQDQDIFPDAIRPYQHLSAGFDIFLGEFYPTLDEIKKFKKFIQAHGGNPDDPKLALGWLQLGELVGLAGKSQKEIRKLFCEYSVLNGLIIEENGEKIIEMPFPTRDSVYHYLKK